MATAMEVTITDDEAKLYDRQIRLWGIDAQKRLRNSHILVVGINGAQAEACKNVVLAGIGAMTILDPVTITTSDDLSAQFLLNRADVGKNRAEAIAPRISELNPNVAITCITDSIDNQDDEFLDQFTVVLVAGASLAQIDRLERRCAAALLTPAVFICETINFDGFFMQNLHKHTYLETVPGENGEADTQVDKAVQFKPLTSLFTMPTAQLLKTFGSRLKSTVARLVAIRFVYMFRDAHGRWPTKNTSDWETISSLRDALVETERISPDLISDAILDEVVGQWQQESASTCAIIGGILGQEVLKTISHKDLPLGNVTYFSGWEGCAINMMLDPSDPLAK